MLFLLLTIIPNLFFDGDMAKESFFIFAVMSVLGFIYFRYLLKKDRTESFGRSTIVWFGLLLLILFSTVIWLGDVIKESNQEVQNQIAQRYSGAIPETHPYLAEAMCQSNLRVLAAIIILVGHLQTKTGFYGKWSILLRICGT